MVKKKQNSEEEVMMSVKLPRHLRDRFSAACKSRDSSASRELREFMRKYLSKNISHDE